MQFNTIYILKIFYDHSDVEFIIKNIYYFNEDKNILFLINISEDLFNKYEKIINNLSTIYSIYCFTPLKI